VDLVVELMELVTHLLRVMLSMSLEVKEVVVYLLLLLLMEAMADLG